jgi:hypothetical protein
MLVPVPDTSRSTGRKLCPRKGPIDGALEPLAKTAALLKKDLGLGLQFHRKIDREHLYCISLIRTAFPLQEEKRSRLLWNLALVVLMKCSRMTTREDLEAHRNRVRRVDMDN